MLVLSRKQGERIVIGDGIELQVLDIRGGRVRLGITCPDDVRVLRTELLIRPLPTAGFESAKQPSITHSHRNAT